jgi:hypothetical protein
LTRLNETILKDHTVMPGEWYGGIIVLDVPQKDQSGNAEYTLTLPFGGEVHEFRVRQARIFVTDYLAPVLHTAFLVFLLIMAGEWAVDKIRGCRKRA